MQKENILSWAFVVPAIPESDSESPLHWDNFLILPATLPIPTAPLAMLKGEGLKGRVLTVSLLMGQA